MIGACLEAARSRFDDPADIANCAIEELVRQRRELPVLNTLLRAARKAQGGVNRAIRLPCTTLDEGGPGKRLRTLLNLRPGETRTPWDGWADAPGPRRSA